MTLAEITRRIKSFNRKYRLRMKERAALDYRLADLIGISVGRNLSKDIVLPSIEDCYPELFIISPKEKAEEEQRQIDVLSAARFLEFATAHNAKYNMKGGES